MAKKAKPIKSKRIETESGKLEFAIPDDANLKDMTEHGLIVPIVLDDKKAEAPLDFTSLSSREVGYQHSAWALRHSYLIYLLGLVRAEIGNLRYDLKNKEAQLKDKYQTKYKQQWRANAAVGRNKAILRMRKRLAKAEAQLARYEALATSYEGMRNAASREIARRSDERASRD